MPLSLALLTSLFTSAPAPEPPAMPPWVEAVRELLISLGYSPFAIRQALGELDWHGSAWACRWVDPEHYEMVEALLPGGAADWPKTDDYDRARFLHTEAPPAGDQSLQPADPHVSRRQDRGE